MHFLRCATPRLRAQGTKLDGAGKSQVRSYREDGWVGCACVCVTGEEMETQTKCKGIQVSTGLGSPCLMV